MDENMMPGEPAVKPGKDKFLPISIIVAAVVLGGAIVFASVYHTGSAPQAGDTGTATAPTMAPASAMTLGPRDGILGDPNAKVTLIEYGDYQCPFCVEFFLQTQPQIVANYVDTRKVRMTFRNFPFLGPESFAAAAAAECAQDQNKLWAYHDALYAAKAADDAKGGSENDGFYTRAEFLKLATQAGLDQRTFTTCLDSNKYTTAVQDEAKTAGAVGVNSTPTFLLNGQMILGAQPYASFAQAIDALLAK